MTTETIKALAIEAHETAVSKGWYEKEVPVGVTQCNLISELMEAWNEYAHNHGIAEIYLTKDAEGRDKENGVPVELADFCIRALDAIGYFGITDDVLAYGKRAVEAMLTQIKAECPLNELPFDTYLTVMSAGIATASSDDALLASLVTCILWTDAWCEAHDIGLAFAIRRKMDYNKTRRYRHGGKLC